MKNNGAEVVHLATGLIVGYPPCPHIEAFCDFLRMKYGVEVVVGTHPIPEKYYQTHTQLGTWNAPHWPALLEPTLTDQKTRLAYD